MSTFFAKRDVYSPVLSGLSPVNFARRVASLLVMAAVLALTSVGAGAAETWTDNTGQFQVEAEFLLLHGEDVYLRRADGVTLKVPLERLSPESQQLAQRLAAEPAVETPETEEDSPAAAEAPDAAMRVLMTSMQAGDLGAAWNALPPSYQNDVNEVVRLFGENMDRDIWNAATRMLEKGVVILTDQKPFVLGWVETLEQDVDLEGLGEGMDAVAGVLNTILQSELGDLDQLKEFDGQAFMVGTGEELRQQLAALAENLQDELDPAMMPVAGGFPGMELPDLDNVQFSTVQADEDTATLRVEQNGEVEDHPMVRVEGRWLPQMMVEEWDEGIQEIKATLEAMPEQMDEAKQMLLSPMSPLRMVEGVLDQLGAARDQDEFNQVIEQITEMAGQMMGDLLGGFDEPVPFENGDELPFDFPDDEEQPFDFPDDEEQPFDFPDDEDDEEQPFGEPGFDEPADEPAPFF